MNTMYVVSICRHNDFFLFSIKYSKSIKRTSKNTKWNVDHQS